MPRPKPSEPYKQVALRLTPEQVAKVQALCDVAPFTFTGAIRHMIEFHEVLSTEDVGRIMGDIGKRQAVRNVTLADLEGNDILQGRTVTEHLEAVYSGNAVSGLSIQVGPNHAKPGERAKKR